MDKLIDFIKRGFTYIVKMDMLIFIVFILAIILLLLGSAIYGWVHRKVGNKDKKK